MITRFSFIYKAALRNNEYVERINYYIYLTRNYCYIINREHFILIGIIPF